MIYEYFNLLSESSLIFLALKHKNNKMATTTTACAWERVKNNTHYRHYLSIIIDLFFFLKEIVIDLKITKLQYIYMRAQMST